MADDSLTRRRLLALTGTGAAAGAAGCLGIGGGSDGDDQQGGSSDPATLGKVHVLTDYNNDAWQTQWEQTLKPAFQEQTDIGLRLEYAGFSGQNESRLATLVQSGDPPALQTSTMDQVGSIFAVGALAPVTETIGRNRPDRRRDGRRTVPGRQRRLLPGVPRLLHGDVHLPRGRLRTARARGTHLLPGRARQREGHRRVRPRHPRLRPGRQEGREVTGRVPDLPRQHGCERTPVREPGGETGGRALVPEGRDGDAAEVLRRAGTVLPTAIEHRLGGVAQRLGRRQLRPAVPPQRVAGRRRVQRQRGGRREHRHRADAPLGGGRHHQGGLLALDAHARRLAPVRERRQHARRSAVPRVALRGRARAHGRPLRRRTDPFRAGVREGHRLGRLPELRLLVLAAGKAPEDAWKQAKQQAEQRLQEARQKFSE